MGISLPRPVYPAPRPFSSIKPGELRAKVCNLCIRVALVERELVSIADRRMLNTCMFKSVLDIILGTGAPDPVITLRDSKNRKSTGHCLYLGRLGSQGYRRLIAQGIQPSAHCAGADTGIQIRGFAAAWQLHRGYQ